MTLMEKRFPMERAWHTFQDQNYTITALAILDPSEIFFPVSLYEYFFGYETSLPKVKFDTVYNYT